VREGRGERTSAARLIDRVGFRRLGMSNKRADLGEGWEKEKVRREEEGRSASSLWEKSGRERRRGRQHGATDDVGKRKNDRTNRAAVSVRR